MTVRTQIIRPNRFQFQCGRRTSNYITFAPSVTAEPKQFGNITLNPDLVFATGNIGDVKYKLNKADWHRPDLYEVVTFASGYKASRAVIINFCVNSLEHPQTVEIGPVQVSTVSWNCLSFPEPQMAEEDFLHNVRNWIQPPM